ERRQLAHLQHRGVAQGQTGRDLPRRRHEGHVPRRDQRADTDGMEERVVEVRRRRIGVAVDTHAHLGEVVEIVGGARHELLLRLADHLAGVTRLGLCDRCDVGGDQVAQLSHQAGAFGRGLAGPGRKRRLGGGDGRSNFPGAAAGDFGEHFLRRRIHRLEVVAALDRAAPDQMLDSHSPSLVRRVSAPEHLVADDGVGEPADIFDLADDLVAHADVDDAFGRPREYHVAGLQRHEAAQVFDEERDVEHEVARVALLYDAAVDGGLQLELRRRRHVGGVDEPGAEHRAAVAALDAQIRAVPVLEIVADRVVVGDGIAGDMGHRVGASDLPRWPADHDRELAFVVHEGHAGGTSGLPAMADERTGSFEKDERLFLRVERQLLRVISVIEAQGDDGADLEWWQPDDGIFSDDAAVGEAKRARSHTWRRFVDGTRVGDAGALHASGSASAVRASSRPRPSISMATCAFGPTCGAPGATPASRRSPGASVMKSLTSATSRTTLRNVPPVLASCTRRPSTKTRTPSASALATALAWTTVGPMTQDASRARNRIAGRKYDACGTLKSPTMTKPAMHSGARLSPIAQAVRPMTMPSAAPTSTAPAAASTCTAWPGATIALRGLM